jgi:hypothetical protein
MGHYTAPYYMDCFVLELQLPWLYLGNCSVCYSVVY